MVSLQGLKPRFQGLLRPLVKKIADTKYTANQVTITAMLLSVVYGVLLYVFPYNTFVLIGLPLLLLVRMALNAIDGMLAREHDQQSILGAYLNEVGDIVSDLALYIPFIIYFTQSTLATLLFTGFLIGMVTAEMVGIMAVQFGGERRYDGPLGKSDRALCMGVFAVFLAFVHISPTIILLIAGMLCLLVWATVIHRYRKASEKFAKGEIKP